MHNTTGAGGAEFVGICRIVAPGYQLTYASRAMNSKKTKPGATGTHYRTDRRCFAILMYDGRITL